MKTYACPICGVGVMKKQTGTQTFEYKGEATTISNYEAWVCGQCKEAVVDGATLQESGRILKNFKRKVDGLLTGEQIREIRMKLGLTQEQLSDIIGGGLKSVARYESGKVCQSKGMDNLLRILNAYPETLNVIQTKKECPGSSARVIYIEDARNKNAYRLAEKTFSDEKEAVYGA